ncbi:MAG: BLUF domain-containing protein [Hyphomicrobiales bacterium]
MRYLIYVSQAAKPMSSQELSEILEKSRDYNERDGVTGLLVYKFNAQRNTGNFMQLLEGPADVLKEAFRRISDDQRHHTKIVLEEGDISERNFPNWSMGFKSVVSEDLMNAAGFTDLGEESFALRAQAGEIKGALDIMKSFYEEDD